MKKPAAGPAAWCKKPAAGRGEKIESCWCSHDGSLRKKGKREPPNTERNDEFAFFSVNDCIKNIHVLLDSSMCGEPSQLVEETSQCFVAPSPRTSWAATDVEL